VKCVERSQCKCAEGNVTYTDGQSWNVGQCMKCHCVEGREHCSEICLLTEEMCKKEGKKLFNKDLSDSTCCRCVTDQPHCMHNGEEKAIGSVWHKGVCETYKCTKTADDVGMITMTKTECAPCAADEDKEYVAHKCCPICKKKTAAPTSPNTPKTPPTTPKKTGQCTEILSKPSTIAENRVALHPATKGTPHDLTSEHGWAAHESDKATITLTTSTNDGSRPGLVQELHVLGNIKTVTIEYAPIRPAKEGAVFKPYNAGKTIDVTGGEILLTREDGSRGIHAYVIKITIVKAVQPDKPLAAKLNAIACIEDVPEPCTDFEAHVCAEIMNVPGELPDHRIQLHPAATAATIASLRPSGHGWTVQPKDSPTITVNIASKDGQKPGLIEQIEISGNVKTVGIKVRITTPGTEEHNHHHAEGRVDSEGYTEYNNGQPIDVHSGLVVLHESPSSKKSGIIAYQVRITVLTPVKADAPYSLKLKVYACIQVELEDVFVPEGSQDIDHPVKDDHKHPEELGPCLESDKPHHDKPHHDEPHHDVDSPLHPHSDDPHSSHDQDEPEKQPEIGCVDIMSKPDELPDKQIHIHPAGKGTPSDLRPNSPSKGLPVHPSDHPVITVDLTAEEGRLPGLLSKIGVHGNVKEVSIKVRTVRPRAERQMVPTEGVDPEGFTELNHGKPIDVEHEPITFVDPASHKPGQVVYQVRITLLKPIKPEEPYNAKLSVVACIQNDLEIISVGELKELIHHAEIEKHHAQGHEHAQHHEKH